jgi:hypothetical protein
MTSLLSKNTYTVQKFHIWKLISKAARHNKDCIVCVKVVYLSPPLSKPDLTLSSMDHDAGHTSSDIGRKGNSFVFVVVSSSRGSSFLCDWVSWWLSTRHRARLCQLLVYIYQNQCFHMGNYILLYQGVCLKDPPGFYVNPTRMSMPKAIALRILCILRSLELDAFYSIDILFVNRLVVFIFIKL